MKKEFAIKVENISKKYFVGKQRENNLRGSLGKLLQNSKSNHDEFWALNNISFNVLKGEVIGIIGNNGAGKSTILKILSQITKPTEGQIEIKGRVASLLEVGTGFHPELTGRENIFLNGTILGMSKTEVRSKLEEIIEFSGVSNFLDTPVKHYSSGMYVRLAFAVAAHLEPDILIIDEVLSVGDAAFQKKCIGKMKDVSSSGRTVIFVSHDLGAITSLCDKGILLEKGKVILQGEVKKVVNTYLNNSVSKLTSNKEYLNIKPLVNDGVISMKFIKLINSDNKTTKTFSIDKEIGIQISFDVLNSGYNPIPNIHFFDSHKTPAFVSVNNLGKDYFSKKGSYTTTLWIPQNFLNNGYYFIHLVISSFDVQKIHVLDEDCLKFEVIDKLDTLTRNGYTGKIKGLVRPMLLWKNN